MKRMRKQASLVVPTNEISDFGYAYPNGMKVGTKITLY